MPYRATEKTRARQAETRLRILEAARHLVGEGGYAAAHVTAVARRAGVGTGTVYRYFPSKGELFAEVFRRVCARELELMEAAAASDESPRARVVTMLRVFAERALRSGRMAHALIAEPVDEAVDVERLRFRAAYTEILSELIDSAVAARECEPVDAPVVAAFLVGGVAQSLASRTAVSHLPLSESEAGTLLRAITRAVDRAVFGELP